jgi:hypothetical protein
MVRTAARDAPDPPLPTTAEHRISALGSIWADGGSRRRLELGRLYQR